MVSLFGDMTWKNSEEIPSGIICFCCGWFHIRNIRRCLYISGIPAMLVKDYGPSMAVLQALGDMPLGSLEHDGGVGIPAQKFGLFWVAGQRQVLGSIASDTPRKQLQPIPCTIL